MKPSPVLQPTYRDLTREEIADALGFIDPNCARPEWARMGMAIKSELGPDGFDIWDKWSQTGENYDAKAARDTWKSISASGGINIGTMIAEAMQFGFKFNQDDRTPIGQDEIDRRARERKERDDAAKAEKTLKRAAAAVKANATWEAAQDIDGDDHLYLKRKGVMAHGVRVGAWKGQKDALLIPMRTIEGAIVSLQAISANPAPTVGRAKDFLFDGQMSGTMHWIGDIPNAATVVLVVAEGYATGASVHMASGYSVAVGFTAGNLRNVALALRAKFPQVIIIVAAENDKWNKTNAGMVGAQQACTAARAMLASPVFKDDATQPTDFNDLHQLEGIDAVRGQINSCLPRADNDNEEPSDVAPIVPLEGQINTYGYPHQTEKYQPMDTVENLEFLMKQYGIKTMYNVVAKEIEVVIPGLESSMDNEGSVASAVLTSLCARNRMPRSNIDPYVLAIADKNQYNPAAEWIDSKAWDGIDRLDALVGSLDAEDKALAFTLLRRWMIGAVGCVYSRKGMSMQGVLVLQGAQYAGKTEWFWQLTGKNERLAKEGVSLDPADRDSVKGAVSHWLVELGEIDATFKKSDIESLKQYITRQIDELFLRYSKKISKFPRRTAYFGTVNPLQFLHDDTGNRRYWTIKCGSLLNAMHGIDMQQCWAQVKTIWASGEQHRLTVDEMKALNAANEEHEQANPIEELILTRFQWDKPPCTNMSATEVLLAIGYDKPNNKQAKDTGTILRKITKLEPKKSNGRTVFLMPPLTQRPDSRFGAYPDNSVDRPW